MPAFLPSILLCLLFIFFFLNNKQTLKNYFFSLQISFFMIIGGCASYQKIPLIEQETPENIETLVQNAMLSPFFTNGAVTLKDGLNLDELANLAIFNSPLLKVQQQQYNVDKSRAYNLSLLPDPQLSASFDHSQSTLPNTFNAWTGGIGYDLNALITHQSFTELGEQQKKQAKLTLLWQAWQIKLHVKLISVDIYYTNKKINLMNNIILKLEKRYKQSQIGMIEGNLTLEKNSADLSVLLDAYSQLKTFQEQYNNSSHQLTRLLGIKSLTGLIISPLPILENLNEDDLLVGLTNIVDTRPDLLALQSGYLAQEANVRAAILSQFPSLNLGISAAKDTGGLHTQGLNIGITLPLFNANKGNILITRATRKQLAEEYQLRLIQTRSEIDELLQLDKLINQQQERIVMHLPALQQLVFKAEKAYTDGDIDALPFISIESTWLNKRLEQLELARNKWRTQLSITLLIMHDITVPNIHINGN